LGLAEACSYPTFARALANWMRRGERAMASGLIHMGSNLGGIFTPIFIAFIISRFGWRHSFLLSGLLTFVVALYWWRTGTDEPSQNRRVSPEELQLILSDREESQFEKVDLRWYKQLACSREAYMLCASCFFMGVSSFVFLTWFYTYLVQVRGTSDLYSAVLTSLTYLAGAFGALFGGILCDASVRHRGNPWGRRIVPLFSMIASGLLCIIAPVIRNNTGSVILFALAAGLQVVPAPAFWATIIDITRRGPALVGGFMNGSGNLGAALGTIGFPWLVARIDWQLALQVAGSTGIISGLLWLLIDSSRQIDSSPPVTTPSISVSATLGTTP
jgi:ACS family glucarate transporter-like MFS transporter